MRIGQKITFEPVRDFGTLKAGRRYTGYFVGKCFARYQNYTVRAQNIEPVALSPVSKPKDITSAEYKAFADLCFEVAVRYRDGWKSIISGKKFLEYHWDGIHAGHFIGRDNWPTRHLPMNCHAITKDENRAMAHGDARVWEKYRDYLIKTYGKKTFEEMMALKNTTIRLTTPLLQDDCKFCFNFLIEQVKTQKRAISIMNKRFEKIPKKTKIKMLEIMNTLCNIS